MAGIGRVKAGASFARFEIHIHWFYAEKLKLELFFVRLCRELKRACGKYMLNIKYFIFLHNVLSDTLVYLAAFRRDDGRRSTDRSSLESVDLN